MKRKIVSIALCLLMLLSAIWMVSCGEEDVDIDILKEEDDSRAAVTLNFYVITDERTTDEAVQLMQAAFNQVSELKYRTRVEFTFCTADEYGELMEEKFTAIENGEATYPGELTEDKGELEYVVDDLGQQVVKYPEVADGQIDILLINSREMLTEYAQAGRLKNLNEYLNGEFKSVKSYINTDLYNSVALNGAWYGVPNNKVLGSYTYLLVNRDAAAKSYLTEEDFYSVYGTYDRIAVDYARVQQLVEDVAAQNAAKAGDAQYVPMTPLLSTFDYPAVEFWTEDNRPSVFATFYDANTSLGDLVTLINPLVVDKSIVEHHAAESYISYLRFMAACREHGYTEAPAGAGEAFAAAVVKGDYSLRRQYEDDYFVLKLDNPRLVEEDMFTSLFAVSSYTRSTTRAMEIISDLTSSEELRNILQYGVEGTHFIVEKNEGVEMAKRISNDYIMDLNYTGNAFMAYPSVTDGHLPTVWQEGMVQNSEAIRVPTYGCSQEYLWSNMQASLIDSQIALSLKPLTGVNIANGTQDEYMEKLHMVIFKSLYPEYVQTVEGEDGEVMDIINAPSEELEEAMTQLVADITDKILAGVSLEAAGKADSLVLDARSLSDAYMEQLLSCQTVEEFDLALEAIREEMAVLPIFTNKSDVRDTPFSMYLDYDGSQTLKSTLAGSLRDWFYKDEEPVAQSETGK